MATNPCPDCRSNSLWKSEPVSAGGNRAPNYLPGLGKWWKAEYFTLVMCADCGLTRFYASAEARAKLSESGKWSQF